MEIAGKITLITSIVWVIWSILSLRNAVVEGEGIVPASILSVLFWIISIVTILIFHLSPLHLIWLFILGFPLAFFAMMTPLGQEVGIGLLALLSWTRTENTNLSEGKKSSDGQKKSNKRKNTKKRGFGN
ncbi:MAG: hypothetical protein AB4060_06035 [Crocosphaera sp.]